MKKIRVLALNDDNHETSFHTEWSKGGYHTYMDFIQMIAKPHDWEYEIRCVHLLNVSDKKTERAFDIVQCAGNVKLLDYLLAFEQLWEHSTNIM